MQVISAVGTADTRVQWAVVVVRDGLAASAFGVSNGADFYTPEQQVLAFGIAAVRDNDVGSGPAIMPIEGSTKTMRKLKQGDLLQFQTLASTANGALVHGIIQFFCKS